MTFHEAPLERGAGLWHGADMAQRTARSGGFFLMLAILIGFVWGFAGGDPMKGVLIGTAVGVLIALAIWLVDRSRR